MSLLEKAINCTSLIFQKLELVSLIEQLTSISITSKDLRGEKHLQLHHRKSTTIVSCLVLISCPPFLSRTHMTIFK
jgi:hypothetical protein